MMVPARVWAPPAPRLLGCQAGPPSVLLAFPIRNPKLRLQGEPSVFGTANICLVAGLVSALEGASSEEGCFGKLLPLLAVQACASEVCSSLVVTWAGYLPKASLNG